MCALSKLVYFNTQLSELVEYFMEVPELLEVPVLL